MFLFLQGMVYWQRVKWISTDVGLLLLLRKTEQKVSEVLWTQRLCGLGEERARGGKALNTESEWGKVVLSTSPH